MIGFIFQSGILFFTLQNFAFGSMSGNAGCIIRSGDQIVLVKDIWSKRYGLPGGTAEANETAEQTAERETREETGIKVSAGQLLKKTENAFYIFDCEPSERKIAASETGKISVPVEAFNEIGEIKLINPKGLPVALWRFPQQRQIILELIPQAHSYSRVPKSSINPPPMFEMELNWIRNFQSYQNRLMDLFFKFFSFLGGEESATLILPFIFFGISKRKGMELTFLFCLSILIHETCKAVFSIPRPFFFIPELQRGEAEGFGFPSGHTLSVTLVWSWVALNFQFPWRWLLAGILATFGGLARVYWGVHFFHDVIGGWLLALTVIGFYVTILKLKNFQNLPINIWFIASGLIGGISLFVSPNPISVAVSAFLLGLIFIASLSKNAVSAFEKPSKRNYIELPIVLVGIFVISFAASKLSSSGAFLPCLITRIAKYLLLGIWVGSAAVFFSKDKSLLKT